MTDIINLFNSENEKISITKIRSSELEVNYIESKSKFYFAEENGINIKFLSDSISIWSANKILLIEFENNLMHNINTDDFVSEVYYSNFYIAVCDNHIIIYDLSASEVYRYFHDEIIGFSKFIEDENIIEFSDISENKFHFNLINKECEKI